MKNTTATIAFAIATLAAGSAFAGDSAAITGTSLWEKFPNGYASSTEQGKTREQVQAELTEYKRANSGAVNFGSGLSTWAKFPAQAGTESVKTRADVKAELAQYKRTSAGTVNFGSGLSTWEKYSSKSSSM